MARIGKEFANFLKTRKPKPWECDHDSEHWCQNCIAKPQQVNVVLPNGDISSGYIFTNIK